MHSNAGASYKKGDKVKALKWQIVNKLTSDATYLSLMGSPTVKPYNTYWFKPPDKPTFPEVVLNISSGENDVEMDGSILSGRFTLGVNVWSKSDEYESIAERIIQLLHQNPETDTLGFRAVYTGSDEDLIDDTFAVYGKRISFNVYYRRALI